MSKARLIAGLLTSGLWVFTILAGIVPSLHELVHPDHPGLDHQCAVTLLQKGQLLLVMQPPPQTSPPGSFVTASPVCDHPCFSPRLRSNLTRGPPPSVLVPAAAG